GDSSGSSRHPHHVGTNARPMPPWPVEWNSALVHNDRPVAPGPRSPAPELRIHLLGTFRIDLNDRPVPVDRWHRSKAKALVKLLALSRSHRRHREQCIDILWPEAASGPAAVSLRKAIHHARQ